MALTKDDKKWLRSLPHPVFFSHSGFKHKVMERLGIDQGLFARWVTPYEWLEAGQKETRRHGL